MNKKFSIELCGDLDFEGMVVDITYDRETVASINYEKGIDNMEIELLSCGEESSRCILPLQDFLETLEKATQLAMKCAKEDEELRKKGIDF